MEEKIRALRQEADRLEELWREKQKLLAWINNLEDLPAEKCRAINCILGISQPKIEEVEILSEEESQPRVGNESQPRVGNELSSSYRPQSSESQPRVGSESELGVHNELPSSYRPQSSESHSAGNELPSSWYPQSNESQPRVGNESEIEVEVNLPGRSPPSRSKYPLSKRRKRNDGSYSLPDNDDDSTEDYSLSTEEEDDFEGEVISSLEISRGVTVKEYLNQLKETLPKKLVIEPSPFFTYEDKKREKFTSQEMEAQLLQDLQVYRDNISSMGMVCLDIHLLLGWDLCLLRELYSEKNPSDYSFLNRMCKLVAQESSFNKQGRKFNSYFIRRSIRLYLAYADYPLFRYVKRGAATLYEWTPTIVRYLEKNEAERQFWSGPK